MSNLMQMPISKDVGSNLLLLVYFDRKSCYRHQTPHVASDLGLHCLPMTLYEFPGKNGIVSVVYRL